MNAAKWSGFLGRAVLIVVVFAVAAGTGWYFTERPVPPDPAAHQDLNTVSGMRGLLPQPGAGPVAGVEPGSRYAGNVPSEEDWVGTRPVPEDECLPAHARGRAPDVRASPISAVLRLPDGRSTRVAYAHLTRPAADSMRSALHQAEQKCDVRPEFGGSSPDELRIRVRAPRYGEAVASYRALDRVDEGRFAPGSSSVFALSGTWLVRLEAGEDADPATRAAVHAFLGSLDEKVRTRFLAPTGPPDRSRCAQVNTRVAGSPPLGVPAVQYLGMLHDLACADERDGLVRQGFAEPERLDPAALPGLVRTLEAPAVYRNGAITYRDGNSAALFDFPREAIQPTWRGFVRECTVASGACDPARYGPLGDVDWKTVITDLPCLSGLPLMVGHVDHDDVTGDGRPDAVLAASCEPTTSSRPDQVRVYDGAAPAPRPRLVATLLTEHDGIDARGLRVRSIARDRDTLVVTSRGYAEDDPNAAPSFLITDRFRIQGGTFQRLPREVAKTPS